MKRMLLAGLFVFSACGLSAQSNKLPSKDDIPQTLVNEAKASIQRGVNFLTDKQMPNGSWLNSAPVTGLACMALHQSFTKKLVPIRVKAVEKGREYILKNVQKNGSIVEPKSPYINYSTAVCLAALAIINNPADKEIMRKARHFLIDSQLDEDNKKYPTKKSNPSYGGIGYGSAGPLKPDLSNTQWALEALYLTNYLDSEVEGGTKKDAEKSELAWANAVKFLKAVQNVPESADDQWIVNTAKDAKNDGGFIYKPGDSKVNSKLKKQGKDAGEGLRSYGSMTYAGLKSMIYAKLKKDDYRVKAAIDWARKHYTLKENPVMGEEGHYYYLNTFAKAHAAYGDSTVKLPNGKVAYWRIDLIKQLLNTQKSKGEWTNPNGRWMESVPELVTSYALVSMEIALGKYLAE